MTIKRSIRTIASRRRAPIDSTAAPKSDKIEQVRTICSTCNLRALCVPCCGLTRSEMEVAERLFNRARVLQGEHLYRTGDRFTSLYAVRHGFFKSTALLEHGRDQVTGFSMAGEVLGLDGIGPERHTCNTIALEDSEICTISFAMLQELAKEIPRLQRHFFKMMSREIEREHGLILQLGSMNAEERVAMFLLNLSQRFAARGYSRSEFYLRMTRTDIGSYLGLKLETVSRTLSMFQEEGLIRVRQRLISILDLAGLEGVMGRDRH